ncbi:electron transfer flavoprotein-ubiquinone oxidoreductase [Pseudobdellovibrio exovorus]|uniref:Electron transfer flavoprotein-ubiquinone oxidoreductase n=1 Tax=Pseudobdellovibrio exovorus JSS TaxID=1184267 RepID=M4V6L7_9BACT|nr:electron transfer flavoprotein-ubiquinone oxidoreductase [Pseudobdellovibrio exovorus]AGH94997.1 electron transfer flavoprotein-ubiquinone oxidoreductase [Pseudobdellovibrio exovorus JSS]
MQINDSLPEGVTRDTMEVDVLIVGGGAAGLSCAYKIASQIEQHNQQIAEGKITGEPIPEQMIVVIEKGSEIGAHSFSGAVLNPKALEELIPNYKELECPLDSEVKKDAVYYLSGKSSFKLPVTPPPFHNVGNYIVSLSKFNRWLATQCEAKGINIFPGFAAVEALYEGDRIVGVRTGDKGRDKEGNPKANFEPGLILKAKTTVFAEGTRGSLFKQVSKKLNLRQGKNAEAFEEGVKEIIQMPAGTVEAGEVIHTMGYPLNKSIGGTFLYTIPGDKIILGIVAYLDSKDPLLDPHRELQKLKTHPFIAEKIKGGKVLAYGGKTLPAGGWYSMPKLFGDGFMVCGDSASMVDVQKLKGIHLAMKSGMLAAETAFEAILKQDSSAEILKGYEARVHDSYVKSELYRVRNFHQTLSKGFVASLPLIALQEITGGRGLFDGMKSHEDAKTTLTVNEVWGSEGLQAPENKLPASDGELMFDKLGSVYLTGTTHDEDSPNHLLLQNPDVCRTVCEPQYKSPCNHFCPASVYEMVPSKVESGKYDLQINYTNCIHCKTCDIKCPFENIDWTVPEGGGGPKYIDT